MSPPSPLAMMLLSLAGCASPATVAKAGVAQPLTAEETQFLCAVLPGNVERLGSSEEDGASEASHRRASEVIGSIRWHQGGGWPECAPGQPLRLTSFHYVDGFGLSADGSIGAISGGWQMNPLAGGWGQCYFERHGSEWSLLGCTLSAVS